MDGAREDWEVDWMDSAMKDGHVFGLRLGVVFNPAVNASVCQHFN